MAEDNDEDGENGQTDGEDGGRFGDRDGGLGDGHCDGFPGSDRGCAERALLGLGVENTGVCLHEEDEHAGGQEHGNDGSNGLSVPLELGRSAQQETDTEINHKIGTLASGSRGDSTSDQVHPLGSLGDVSSSGGGTSENELSSFGGGGERGGISHTSALDGKESKDETQEDCENRHADIEVILQTEDNAGSNDDEDQWRAPLPHLNLVLLAGRVLDNVFGLDVALSLEEVGVLSNLVGGGVHSHGHALPCTLKREPDEFVLNTELSKGRGNHDKNTGPQKPVTWRRVVNGVLEAKRVEADEVSPFRELWVTSFEPGNACSQTGVDESGPNNTFFNISKNSTC